MNNFGLTEERYNQMMLLYENDEDAIKEIVKDWGAEKCNKGWDIFNYDGLDILEVEAICDVGAFDDDEATQRAIAEGIKIIPVEELPTDFPWRWLGWIDTPENRKRIKEVTKNY